MFHQDVAVSLKQTGNHLGDPLVTGLEGRTGHALELGQFKQLAKKEILGRNMKLF